MLQIVVPGASYTLGAGPTEILGANGIDVGGYQRLSYIVLNTGAADLTEMAVYWADAYTGSNWSPADEGIYFPNTTLAPGQSVEITVTDISHARMRLVITGTAGQTLNLTLSAVWA